MAAVFKVDGTDLSAHLKVNQGDGLDPYDQGGFLDPQFAEGALSDGDPLLSIREGNREQAWTVILNPARAGYTASKDGLHQLIRDVNRALRNASVIEWRDDGATSSTFFDVQFGRFDPAYDYRRSQQLWVPGVIKAWTKPYGHTGTTPVVATVAGSQAIAVLSIPSGRVDGDADAETFTVISVPSNSGFYHFAGVGVGGADLMPVWAAASMTNAGGTLIGASGAFASQAAQTPVFSASSLGFVTVGIGATTHPDGRLRPIALLRTTAATAAASALALNAFIHSLGPTAGAIGPTQVISTGHGWRVVDLGTFAGGTSLARGETLQINGGMLTASSAATFTWQIAAVLHLPESETVAISQPYAKLLIVQPAAFTFDGPAKHAFGQDGPVATPGHVFLMDEALRGNYPQIPVGSGRQAVAFAIPDDGPQDRPISVEIRVREKFTYSR